MKKINKKLLYILSFLILLTGCSDRLKMDMTKSEEVAIQYFQTKYNLDVKINSSKEYRIGHGDLADTYAEIRVSKSNNDEEYIIIVHPESNTDTDSDGYFDSYTAFSDNYMCELIEPVLENQMNILMTKIGINEFCSYVYNISQYGSVNSRGFLADFPVMTNEQYINKEILQQCGLKFYYQILIPESSYSENIEKDIEENVRLYFKKSYNSYVVCKVYVYSQDDYKQVKTLWENNKFNINLFKTLKFLEIYVR